MCENIGHYGQDINGNERDCREIYGCCDCGITQNREDSMTGCGCNGCFSCNACETCLNEDPYAIK